MLQKNEFRRWSETHTKEVQKWEEAVEQDENNAVRNDPSLRFLGKFTKEGQAKARGVIGFKKFLSDFTLVSERQSSEVGLWNESLVFASLFGIAAKVAKELAEINPETLKNTVWSDAYTTRQLLYMTNNLASSITNASAAAKAAAGRGGSVSFGGGAGFSGGGFGGGSR